MRTTPDIAHPISLLQIPCRRCEQKYYPVTHKMILIYLLGLIIDRVQRPVTPASVTNWQRRAEETDRKEVSSFVLDSLPVRRYTKGLLPGEQSNGEVQNLTWSTYPLEQFDANESTMVNNIDTTHDKRRIPSEKDTSQNEDQSEPRSEPPSCSVCTEYFVEGENVRILPCGHVYHRCCIDLWLLDFSSTCPLW
jgi:hypothetical protein